MRTPPRGFPPKTVFCSPHSCALQLRRSMPGTPLNCTTVSSPNPGGQAAAFPSLEELLCSLIQRSEGSAPSLYARSSTAVTQAPAPQAGSSPSASTAANAIELQRAVAMAAAGACVAVLL
jgi:hypothetical protein